MLRPFLNASIVQLEALFEERKDDPTFLRTLLDELSCRSTERARRLKSQVVQALEVIADRGTASSSTERPQGGPSPGSNVGAAPGLRYPEPQVGETELGGPSVSDRYRQTPPISDAPEGILDAWTALEVLSPPQLFRRPEELAGGDRQRVAWLDRDRLPWEGNGERTRPGTRLNYQVVLGTIDFEQAIPRLLEVYADSRAERPSARGHVILASVTLNREGRLVEKPAVSLSSFAWGLPRALQGRLVELSDWRTAEKQIIEKLDLILRRGTDDEEDHALRREEIQTAYKNLVVWLDLPQDLVTPPRFAVRTYDSYRSSGPPDPLLLNSFFLNDLAAAKTLFAEGRATANLKRYIKTEGVTARRDLLQDHEALEAAVAPERMPPARWPGPGRHPLVLLQQAGVNLALQELREGGVLAINGPPGTGKTTLLRDLVAAIVVQRAEVMAEFENPVSAFVHSGEKIKAGAAWLHLYHLDTKLKGFEMIVASSNNKAVENVSAEMPALKAVASDAADLRYFSTLSDALLQADTWGLVAAVLGNSANRGRFKKTFWWDDDFGLSTYLAAAAGLPQVVEITDSKTGHVETRPPHIVARENPPRDPGDALERWKVARHEFSQALKKSRKILGQLARLRDLVVSLPRLRQEESAAAEALRMALDAEARDLSVFEEADRELLRAQEELGVRESRLAEHDRATPGFFARLFRTRRARDWRSARTPLVKGQEEARGHFSAATYRKAEAESKYRESIAARDAAERRRSATSEQLSMARDEVAAARDQIGERIIDEAFFAREHDAVHKTAPWLTEEQQRVRDDVFVAAMKLHKAFIDAAAKPLRHNLGVLMGTFGAGGLPTPEKRALLPDLWASLFLVVPLISTTFASVERMFGDLPPESLGWLFVDEAGQASPQAVVGAILRSRRAVVVGDPVQIEPVVTLPDTLTHAICRRLGVDPDRFNAPGASVQTLADSATPYFAEILGRHGSRNVGVPLLVHRRCAEPMFSISNAIAYERLMVSAKAAGHSEIGGILGPSAWIDVNGSAAEKWCPEEGEIVLTLLRRLPATPAPDIYIITPFVIVAENLRRLVRESGVLVNWTDDPYRWVSEHVGNVHTVQGREAEAVILVLGAPGIHQAGARNWAGGRPNLLNVAVTRAKERLYVIGNRRLWREAGLFRELDVRLPPSA